MKLPELTDDRGNQPGAERQLERHGDGPRLGIDQLVDGRQAVVQVVEQGVDVSLERCPGLGEPQHASVPLQQWCTEIPVQPIQRSRDRGLAHIEDVGDLRDRRAVGDLLEPAQGFSVHDS